MRCGCLWRCRRMVLLCCSTLKIFSCRGEDKKRNEALSSFIHELRCMINTILQINNTRLRYHENENTIRSLINIFSIVFTFHEFYTIFFCNENENENEKNDARQKNHLSFIGELFSYLILGGWRQR